MTTYILLYGMPSVWSLALIAVVVLLIFGGKKIPELMKGLGSGINEFKKGLNGDGNANNTPPEKPKEIDEKK
jgi:sec-independent protein translocase protein TatA